MLNPKNENSNEIRQNKADYFLQNIAPLPEIKTHFMSKYKKNKEYADEIFNDTIIKCYDAILKKEHDEKLVTEKQFKDYFYTALKNNFYNDNKSKKEIPSGLIFNEIDEVTEDGYYEIDEPSDEEIIINNNLKLKEVDSIIKQMKEPYKNLMDDRINNKMKYRELAEKYNISMQTVKNRVRAGKKNIRTKYNEQ